jgi:hypothetical protein
LTVASPNRARQELLPQFQHLTAYYADLLETRVDLLAKQKGVDGLEAIPFDELPTADYLRDASAAESLGLFDWYNTSKTQPSPGGPHTVLGLGLSPDRITVEDRIRAAKTLFAGRYWSQVNEVFASGQGEVRIALIKDDISNWNLVVDSNPEELLGRIARRRWREFRQLRRWRRSR